MGFHVRLNRSNLVKKKTVIGPGSSDGCSPGSLQSQHSHHEVDTQKQFEELFEGAKKQGIEVVPEPKGRPIFMFFPVAGTNKPVLTFFDSGCSDAVVREGIPGVEWKGCITQHGPFNICLLYTSPSPRD